MGSTEAIDTARYDVGGPGSVVLAWRAFNRWRRRYWLLRLVILAILGADAILSHLRTAWLLRVAIDSIFSSSVPTLVHASARARRAGFADQLQRSLRALADRNADGHIGRSEAALARSFGIDPDELHKSGAKADLRALVGASHRVGLLSLSRTPPRILRETLALARSDADALLQANYQAVENLLGPYRTPDYARPETWALGARALVVSIANRFAYMGLGGNLTTATLIIGFAVGLARRRRAWVSALGVCLAACVACVAAQRLLWGMFWGHVAGGWWHMIGVSCKACLIGVVCAQLVWAIRIASAHMLCRARAQG